MRILTGFVLCKHLGPSFQLSISAHRRLKLQSLGLAYSFVAMMLRREEKRKQIFSYVWDYSYERASPNETFVT